MTGTGEIILKDSGHPDSTTPGHFLYRFRYSNGTGIQIRLAASFHGSTP